MGAFRHSDSKQETLSADREDDPRTPKYPRRKRYGWRVFWVVVVLAGVALGVAVAVESRTSRLQAREFSRFAASLGYSMQPGPSHDVVYPGDGPFDRRLGYSSMDEFLSRLLKRDYVITRQTRFSPELLRYVRHGFSCLTRKRPRLGCRSPIAETSRCTNSDTHSSFTRPLPPFRHCW